MKKENRSLVSNKWLREGDHRFDYNEIINKVAKDLNINFEEDEVLSRLLDEVDNSKTAEDAKDNFLIWLRRKEMIVNQKIHNFQVLDYYKLMK